MNTKPSFGEEHWLKVLIGMNIFFSGIFVCCVVIVACGKDHGGVGQLRVRYQCNISDTWKRETRTVYNPEKYCHREFNKLIKELSDKCGGKVTVDDWLCGVAQNE